MRIALFQPDIPQNTGAILRLAACMDIAVDVIEPCGFPYDPARMRRSGMDYIDNVTVQRHNSWDAFWSDHSAGKGRLILLTTRGDTSYQKFAFDSADTLLLGRESAGVPDAVHESADARIVVPMAPGMRSLNVAMAAAMVLGEAARQTGLFPDTFRDTGSSETEI